MQLKPLPIPSLCVNLSLKNTQYVSQVCASCEWFRVALFVCLVLTDARDRTGVKPPRRGDSQALLSIHLPTGLSMSPGFCSLSVPVSSLAAGPLGTVYQSFSRVAPCLM